MANYIVSYDLNGAYPSHKQVDERLGALGATRGRILETVWYVGWAGSRSALFKSINEILSANDRLIVAEVKDMTFRNLLITDESIQKSWSANS